MQGKSSTTPMGSSTGQARVPPPQMTRKMCARKRSETKNRRRGWKQSTPKAILKMMMMTTNMAARIVLRVRSTTARRIRMMSAASGLSKKTKKGLKLPTLRPKWASASPLSSSTGIASRPRTYSPCSSLSALEVQCRSKKSKSILQSSEKSRWSEIFFMAHPRKSSQRRKAKSSAEKHKGVK